MWLLESAKLRFENSPLLEWLRRIKILRRVIIHARMLIRNLVMFKSANFVSLPVFPSPRMQKIAEQTFYRMSG